MREALSEITKQTSTLFDELKVVGTDSGVTVASANDNKTLFLSAKFKNPIPEFKGEFGISNLKLLSGLINFSSYQAEGASLTVKRHDKMDAPEQITFKDARGKNAAVFRFRNSHMELPEIASSIPWDVTITPSKARVSEFTQLAGLYSEVVKVFSPMTEDGDLLFQLGNDAQSTHHASMVFAESVQGKLSGNMFFTWSDLLSVLKLAPSEQQVQVRITSKGVLGIEIDTPIAKYMYYLRAQR